MVQLLDPFPLADKVRRSTASVIQAEGALQVIGRAGRQADEEEAAEESFPVPAVVEDVAKHGLHGVAFYIFPGTRCIGACSSRRAARPGRSAGRRPCRVSLPRYLRSSRAPTGRARH